MAAALMLKLGPYTVLCCIALAMISSYSTTAVYGAPTARENKLLTEGICSMRSILRNRYLHNLKGSSDGLLDTTLELLKMAKGMIEYENILSNLEEEGVNNTDILTSRLMISSVMNHFCSWVTSALNESSLDCTDYNSVLSFVTQMALLESVEETCHTIKSYARTNDEYSGVDHCKWMYCNFNPSCNPTTSTDAMFNSLKRFVPSFCTILWTSHTCTKCQNEGYIPRQPQHDTVTGNIATSVHN